MVLVRTIIYEDHEYYIERTRTLADGSYVFPNLLKGKYKIVAFADDFAGGYEKVERYETVEIRNIDDEIIVDTIYIENELR